MRSICPLLLGALLIAVISLNGGFEALDRLAAPLVQQDIPWLPATQLGAPPAALELGSRPLAPLTALLLIAFGVVCQRLRWGPGLLALGLLAGTLAGAAVLGSALAGVTIAPATLLVAGLTGYAIALPGTLAARAGALRAQPAEMLMPKLLHNSAAAVLTFDSDDLIRSCNPAAAAMFGYPSRELVGTPFARLLAGDGHAPGRPLRRCDGATRELLARRSNGQRFPVHAALSTVDLCSEGIRVAVLHELSEIKAERELLVLQDEVSGLYNRILFQDRLQQALQAAERKGQPLAVLVIHLKLFRTICDTLGQSFGDALIRQIGARLQGLLRRSDTLARLGVSELGALLSELAQPDHAQTKAQWLVEGLAAPFAVEGLEIGVEVNIGVAVYPRSGRNRHRLTEAADSAMLAARRGQHAVLIAGESGAAANDRESALLYDLRAAIEDDRLGVEFLPKLDLPTQRITGVEALVRWQHPDLGPMSTERTLTLAEQGGLMLALTLRVLAQALQQQRAWRGAGCDLMLAVNLAASCLANPQFPQVLQQVLRTWDGDARRLILEVAESALPGDAQLAAATLDRLAGLGCQLALDDFGTGAFSLSALRRLPVDELKIDRCFVAAMTQDDDAAAIVRSAISLGRSLELRVVAEGVPDEPTLAELARLGCDQAQGAFVGPPLPASAFAAWLQQDATPAERQPIPA